MVSEYSSAYRCIIVIPESDLFLRLAKVCIEHSPYYRSEFLVVCERSRSSWQFFKWRKQKVGWLQAFDEYGFCKWEAAFRHWERGEQEILGHISLMGFKPDVLVERYGEAELEHIRQHKATALIALGSGYLPKKMLEGIVRKWNIHPGILPEFKGVGSPEAIMKKADGCCGWTVHDLTPVLDGGEIFCQKKLDLCALQNQTFASIYITIYLDCVTSIWKYNLDGRDANHISQGQVKDERWLYAHVRLSEFLLFRIDRMMSCIYYALKGLFCY